MEELATQVGHWSNRIINARAFVWLVNGAALVLLTASLANWTWMLFQPSGQPMPRASSGSSATSAQTPESRLDKLLAIELFGHNPTADDKSRDAPVTSLNLVLLGVVAAGGESLALISVDGRDQQPFAIGEEIAHGAVLDAVYPDRAIILRRGVRESLVLQENMPSLPLSSVMSPSTMASTSISSGDITKINDSLYRIDRNMLKSQMGSPTLLSQALVVPHNKGGFEMRNITRGSLYEQAGLRSGDVIRKVNGQPINTLDDAMRVYREMGGLDRLVAVNIDIDRGGQSQRLNYQLR
jgi:general secretion pathway protein C